MESSILPSTNDFGNSQRTSRIKESNIEASSECGEENREVHKKRKKSQIRVRGESFTDKLFKERQEIDRNKKEVEEFMQQHKNLEEELKELCSEELE